MPKTAFACLLTAFLLLSRCAIYSVQKTESDFKPRDRQTRLLYRDTQRFLDRCIRQQDPVALRPQTKVTDIRIDRERQRIDIWFNRFMAFIPFRESNVAAIYQSLQKQFGRRFRHYTITAYSMNIPLEQLIPNFYRTTQPIDSTRLAEPIPRAAPVVRNLSCPFIPSQGLVQHNVALWNSHGWYYSHYSRRWEWQRSRLFQTVEDLLPTAFVLPYVIPMLENSGATVFLPRERDIQPVAVIVDNDAFSADQYREQTDGRYRWETSPRPGFAVGEPPYSSGENPFTSGTCRQILTDTVASAVVRWIPDLPVSGRFAVYISYHSLDNSPDDAHYTVLHRGGRTDFAVNQQIGGGTWIYLGHFTFRAGISPDSGCIVLTNQSNRTNCVLTADAVRFGGGIGEIERGGMTSQRAKFMEGARYYLQSAGFPDSLVFSFSKDSDDYRDDYKCRGEWVNYLNGAPAGPNLDRKHRGLGIPIDVSLAFHTDSGITPWDQTIGTLAIYSIEDVDSALIFPNGQSRLTNRDLADLLQTQIVSDLRTQYLPQWQRRHLFNRQYSEACAPNVPSVLLELLSHQNFSEMRFALDPRFRFSASRSIYKALHKFIAFQHQRAFTIQPLPVTHLQALLTPDQRAEIRWRPQTDPLEPTAEPTGFIVYTRRGQNDFDNGTLISAPFFVSDPLEMGVIYSYKVTAINSGGESFPSEILAVCRQSSPDQVLIINGFDRICGPSRLINEQMQGFADFIDEGVPDGYDIGYTGSQIEFKPQSPFLTNDWPGWGASRSQYETVVFAGNSFDYPFRHGLSIQPSGMSFVSVSSECVEEGLIDLTAYAVIDLILGEQRETAGLTSRDRPEFKTLSPRMQAQIRNYCARGGRLFVSGAYVASDLYRSTSTCREDSLFAREVLKIKWAAGHASSCGEFHSVHPEFRLTSRRYDFNTEFRPDIYRVEAPDSFNPADPAAATILRYSENQFSAGVAYRGTHAVVVLGFPFEAVMDQACRDILMHETLQFLTSAP